MPEEPIATPKRKRGVGTTIAPIQFTFDPAHPAEEGSNSPRSKVAHRFGGLAIQGETSNPGAASGSGVASDDEDQDDEDIVRKRHRPDVDMSDATVPAVVTVTDSEGVTVPLPEVVDEPQLPRDNKPEGSLQKAYPSINRLSDSKSRKGRRRAGTPPPRARKKAVEPSSETSEGSDEMEIVDPVRAALTWREDEITIYDPNDVDDDGTGINGVGFRPTHAMAQARVLKRRQQMAEYRKREESEARARRNERRRGQQSFSSSPTESPECRKVRFMEDDNRPLATMS